MASTNLDLQPAPAAKWHEDRYVRLIGFGLVYYLSVTLGVMLVTQPEGISVIWPASGMALAALLLSLRREWASFLAIVFFINLFSNLISGVSFPASAGFSFVNTLEPALGAWLMRRWLGEKITFARLADVLSLLAVAVSVNGFTALLGAIVPMFAFDAPYVVTWLSWWILDGLSILIVTPFLMTWAAGGAVFPWDFLERRLETFAWLIVLVGVTWLMFGAQRLDIYLEQNPYMLFPILIWVALRFSPRAAASALIVTSVIALYSATLTAGFFPVGGNSPREKLISIQAFLCVASVTTMALSATFTERKRAEEDIRNLNEELEQRVEARTRELRDTQERLVRQERLAALGQLAGSVGHELRNPLGVISNAVYFLKMAQPDAAEKIKEYLNIIENETRISEKIITDLLDFTRIKSMERQAVSISRLMRQTLERFPAPASVQVTLDLPEDLPKIYADPQHVAQVFGNLVINAYQSMTSAIGAPKSGTLSVSARLLAEQGIICVVVQDTGVGISLENMNKIFDPLFTTRTRGIGLGLAVSRKLIEANGGRIEVESEAGVGSVFSVYLPVYNELPAA